MNWFSLETEEQRSILETIAIQQGRDPVILEKDVWVVWALAQTFELSTPQLPMAFKGGTSLSKAYAVIQRFSEDLDITLGLFEARGHTLETLSELSRNQRDRALAALQQEALNIIATQILPHLQSAAEQVGANVVQEGNETALTLALHYPSALPTGIPYIKRRVLLEFGGRNSVSPRQQYTINTYLAEDLPASLELPRATVEVLDARRTFWEKLTAVHVACGQPTKLHRLHGFSRHLLDLHCLMKSEIGPNALNSNDLRDDVLATKTLLFRESGISYQDCAIGNAQLVPAGSILQALKDDYRQMEEAGMFGAITVPFGEVLVTLQELQDQLNLK